jgi:poly(hydroxyalkanoate) depolymerase family esterase
MPDPLASRLARFLDRLRALVARPFRRPVAPGRFESGSASSLRGYLTTAPLVEPSRDYLVYIPRGWSRSKRAPLLVLCHGCRQSAEDLAALSRIAEHADREGCLVLMPMQSIDANAWGCWNWFETNTEHGAGEAAIVAAQILQVRRRYRTRRERTWVAGLSAGGALAAILGLRHPRLVRGVFVHSGLPCGAAASAATALSVMRNGPNNDVVAVADEARSRWRDATPPNVALLVVHGDHDDVVAPANAAALVRQYLRFNGDTLVSSNLPLRGSDASSHEAAGVRYGLRTDDWWIDGRVRVREAMVEGLGHAWSGGDAKRAFSDARGPDALELFERFVGDAEGRDRQSRIARLLGTGARALTATPK